MAEDKGDQGQLTPQRIISAVIMAGLLGIVGWAGREMVATHAELIHLGDKIDATRDKVESGKADVSRIESSVNDVRGDVRNLINSTYTKTDADRDNRATDARLQRLENQRGDRK